MSKKNWQTLIERHCPPDKQVCNCRQAYCTRVPGGAAVAVNGKWLRQDSWLCEHGCSAAQIHAREHVAKCVLEEEAKRGVTP